MSAQQTSRDWPTTPIIRCKKRPKPDENSPHLTGNIFHLSGDQPNDENGIDLARQDFDLVKISLVKGTKFIREGTSITNRRRILGENQNENQNLQNPGSRPGCHFDQYILKSHAFGVENLRNCGLPVASSSPIRGEDSQLFEPPCSDDAFSTTWPALEVDQLAGMLKSVHPPQCLTDQADGGKNSYNDSFLPGFSDTDLVYKSSSSSGSSVSDDENQNSIIIHHSKSINPMNGMRTSSKRTILIENQNSNHPRQNKKIHLIRKPPEVKSGRLMMVDCRYPYEYNGGHIRGAVNLAEWPKLRRFFFGTETRASERAKIPKPSRTTFVLHCEFSTQRAPQLFHLLRNYDRSIHMNFYPALRFPKVYVLRGGYAAFYQAHPEFCTPPAYTRMHSRPDLLSRWSKHCGLVNRKQFTVPKSYNSEPRNTASHRPCSPFMSTTSME
ncbi:unnamed protein product [Calicophoron daubneyi]|uniref:protein-tyrosine-phosphatase n=1 Tax=Calicophoron daubneyi TaxID=300641 RepID=A0AAV2TJG3_CALDB